MHCFDASFWWQRIRRKAILNRGLAPVSRTFFPRHAGPFAGRMVHLMELVLIARTGLRSVRIGDAGSVGLDVIPDYQ